MTRDYGALTSSSFNIVSSAAPLNGIAYVSMSGNLGLEFGGGWADGSVFDIGVNSGAGGHTLTFNDTCIFNGSAPTLTAASVTLYMGFIVNGGVFVERYRAIG